MPSKSPTPELKTAVQDFWNDEPCGTRYMENSEDFESHARERYRLEPFIPAFAQFASSRGLRILEVGVGIGADYLEWLRAGANATGVDLSSASLEKARNRCLMAGMQPDLRVADAEKLPFPDDSFDIVYSYGVMHHSPDTRSCLKEASRVLKPGGKARIMIYHHPSLVGGMLWLRYGIFRGRSLRQAVYDHLESPGTKTYTCAEAQQLFEGFENVRTQIAFSPGDLLMNKPSAKYQHSLYKLAWTLFPRRLVQIVGRKLGLFLLIEAQKPLNALP